MNSLIKEILNLIQDKEFNLATILNGAKYYPNDFNKLLPIIIEKLEENNFFNRLSIENKAELNKKIKIVEVKRLAVDYQIQKIIRDISTNSDKVIFLKGTAFNNYLRKQPYRDVNDIDLLVHESAWNTIKKKLCEEMEIFNRVGHGPMHNEYELSLIPRISTGFNVDLHQTLFYQNFFNYDNLNIWDNYKTISLKGININILSNEINYIHQAIHCFKDLNYDRYSIIDTFFLVEHGVDFNDVNLLADAANCARVVRYFYYRYSKYNYPIPKKENKIIYYCSDFLLSGHKKSTGIIKKIYKLAFYFLLLDNRMKVFPVAFKYIFRKLL